MIDQAFFHSADARLMCLTHDHSVLSHFDQAKLLLENGGRLIQVRTKVKNPASFTREAIEIVKLARSFNAKVIINDYADLAVRASAWGVHLGMKDENIADVRKKFGNRLIIGRTVHSLADAQKCKIEKPDYTGIVPFRRSSTKRDLIPQLSKEKFKQIISFLFPLPTFLIGGLSENDSSLIDELNLIGLAVRSALWEGNDRKEQIRKIINSSKPSLLAS